MLTGHHRLRTASEVRHCRRFSQALLITRLITNSMEFSPSSQTENLAATTECTNTYGDQRFTTLFLRSLSLASSIHSTPPHPI
jgi:hypothetical protein